VLRHPIQDKLARSLPFYYGWFVLGIASLSSYSSRPLMAATTLSVFVVPMTDQFGWSRAAFSGALSLGGLCAVAISPLVGRWIDRYGSGVVLSVTNAITGACGAGLSLVGPLWAFYALYVPGRGVFAGPLELATSAAVSNWFIKRRTLALAIFGATQGTGVGAMPLVAQAIIGIWGWRTAWASLGLYTLVIGVLPALLIVRRPEDMGLTGDGAPGRSELETGTSASSDPGGAVLESGDFTVRQALRTRSFWILTIFSAAGFLVQGGVVLHQVPHYISQGLPASSAAWMSGTFAVSQVVGGIAWASLTSRVSLRFLLAATGFCVALGGWGTGVSGTMVWGLAAAATLGAGVGGMHLLLRFTWANYYGRSSFASIRGITLPFQLGGQLIGPIISGFMYDATLSYRAAFFMFSAAAALASFMVMTATPPKAPVDATEGG